MKSSLAIRGRIFATCVSAFPWLPAIRGRTRIFLVLFKILGLDNTHFTVEKRLREPLPFLARLDLGSWLQKLAFITGGYEAETVEFLLRLGRSKPQVGYLLDVGANIGLISIPYALSCNNGPFVRSLPWVVAVEAVTANLKRLQENIDLNGLGKDVIVISTGVGEKIKSVEIQVEGDLSEGEGTGTANIISDKSDWDCVRIQIRISTLDYLRTTNVIPRECSVVKIDTDGYDLKVLQGGVQLLEEDRPVIFGEFSAHCMRWHNQGLVDVLAFAETVRYRVFEKLPGTWLFSSEISESTFSQDLLMIPEEQVDAFSWCIGDPSRDVVRSGTYR